MVDNIDIKVGKIYPIKYLIRELRDHPDIRLGHILALNKHEYHLGVVELEALQKKLIRAEREGDIAAYDMTGKRKIGITDTVVLSIIDPYSQYAKYGKFYEELYGQILTAIDSSTSGVVMAGSEDIINEIKKDIYGIEKEEEVFSGMFIYFARKGIDAKKITKIKEGGRKDYIVFGREGSVIKGEPSDKNIVDRKLPGISETNDASIIEKTKEFEHFYSELEKDVMTFIDQRKDGGAIDIGNIMSEAKKTLPNVENKKDIFLKGMILYFKGKGITTDISENKNFIVFKKL